jgi:hypothetical protein
MQMQKQKDEVLSVIPKKTYKAPKVQSQKVLERAALACSGVFSNPYYNLKTSYYTCGFNDS